MINERYAKLYCSEEISLIENYQTAISDKTKMWEIHHRRECDSEGRTLFTKKQLIEMNLYFERPASELVFVTRSMHWNLHREKMRNSGKKGGKKGGNITRKKQSIPILQFTKDGTFVKEWLSVNEAQRQLRIAHICQCCKGRCKSAGGFVWRYAHG